MMQREALRPQAWTCYCQLASLQEVVWLSARYRCVALQAVMRTALRLCLLFGLETQQHQRRVGLRTCQHMIRQQQLMRRLSLPAISCLHELR